MSFSPFIAALAGGADIPLWLVAPFVLLLVLIAVMPLTPARVKHAWERGYPVVSIVLGGAVAVYYVTRVEGGAGILGHTLHEYVSFILLIGSLFVVAGGIHIKVKGEATPMQNVVFLAVGGIAANFIGTTGASMVLIRPWMRMNTIRASAHHVVFFIFVVSNIGGALTPIGDPPLFLGYLRGVPFFWLIDRVMGPWLLALGLVLAVFYVFDRRSFRNMPARLQREVEQDDTWRFEGTINVLFLLAIIAAVFLPDRYFARELAMLVAAVASYGVTPKQVHKDNAFTFGPFQEVAWLFAGIFATMMPALGYLEAHGSDLGFTSARQYYFATGALSAVLDNAPTYLNFFELARVTAPRLYPEGMTAVAPGTIPFLLSHTPRLVVAISLGSVFFGAMTYIGNGPNFMVRSIAHDAGVRCPTFFGYVLKYSVPILLPILVGVGWLFL